MQRGDIVRTQAGSVGVVVGFPSPNLHPPQSPFVLLLRADNQFGGFDGAYSFQDHELTKFDAIPDGPNIDRRALAWAKENLYGAQ